MSVPGHSSKPSRSQWVDTFKVLAAQFIVWHHLSAYGPLAQEVQTAWPGLIAWLYDYARVAVQVFLVVGGYLAAQGLSRNYTPPLLRSLVQRYRRLIKPFLWVLGLTVLCSALTRDLLPDDLVPAAPTLGQVLAHALLLQDVLEQPALSTGVWYVAIDLQLFALITGLGWLATRWAGAHRQTVLTAGVALGALASLLYFNLNEAWDIWAPYFFIAYGLGALAFWAPRQTLARWCLVALLMLSAASLWQEWRERLALAVVVATVLSAHEHAPLWRGRALHVLRRFSDASYVVFLLHFSVLIVVSALWEMSDYGGAASALGAMATVWVLSLWAGLHVHDLVETLSLASLKDRFFKRMLPG